MKRSITRVGYMGLLAGAILVGSIFHVFGSTNPTVFKACLTPGGTLINVTTQAGAPSCPGGATAVSWDQQGPAGTAGGVTQIIEIPASTTFVVPAGVTHMMVEAWGGGGGGGAALPFPDCVSSAGGGSGGYLRSTIAVTPGESLVVGVGIGGAAGAAGGASTMSRGATILITAGGGGGGTAVAGPGASTAGGAGGQVVSPGGIVRPGNSGANGTFDFMCGMGGGPGTPFSLPGTPGAAIQGSVVPLGSGAGGGLGGSFTNGFVAQPGGPGEVILTL